MSESEYVQTVPVRGFGYKVVHLANIPRGLLEPMSWPSPKYPFTGVRTPVVALCGNQVRSVQPCVVVMNEGTEASCRLCLGMNQ